MCCVQSIQTHTRARNLGASICVRISLMTTQTKRCTDNMHKDKRIETKLAATCMKFTAFSRMTQCWLVICYRRFGGAFCLQLQDIYRLHWIWKDLINHKWFCHTFSYLSDIELRLRLLRSLSLLQAAKPHLVGPHYLAGDRQGFCRSIVPLKVTTKNKTEQEQIR
jgi:hypothetical protein